MAVLQKNVRQQRQRGSEAVLEAEQLAVLVNGFP
jgi:hypothetical protein